MYVDKNPKTKKQLKEWIAEGKRLELFAPGIGSPKRDGIETVEGPHYPKPHTWYARVMMKDGIIEKVVS